MTEPKFYVFLIGLGAIFVVWDGLRRFFNEREQSRRHTGALASELLAKFETFRAQQEEFRTFLRDRNTVQEAALKNAIAEFRSVVLASKAKAVAAETSLLDNYVNPRSPR